MSVYSEIVAWSIGLWPWQRDALRRLLSAPASSGDIAELAAMCLRGVGADIEAPATDPLTMAHVPTESPEAAPVKLLEVFENTDINSLADSQVLAFGPAGLTVVYGDNGAGKSGYARLLKKVCHARGGADDILPNVYRDEPGEPKAKIKFSIGERTSIHAWTNGSPGCPELARAAVFDSKAAHALVEKDNEILWRPGGLDLLEELAKTMAQVSALLEERHQRLVHRPPLPSVPAGTKAATLIAGLSAKTTSAELDAWEFDEAHQRELDDLDNTLSQPDPTRVASELRASARRLRSLAERVASVEAGFGPGGHAELVEGWNELRQAREAGRLAAEIAFEDVPVKGVGSEPWRLLWKAAQDFASSGATPDGIFPSGHSEPCLLCLQPIGSESADRLHRFQKFVSEDVARREHAAGESLRALLARRRALQLGPVADPLISELADRCATTAEWVKTLMAAAERYREHLPEAGPASDWEAPAPLAQDVSAAIAAIAASREAEAESSTAAADPDRRSALELRRNELRGQAAISTHREDLHRELGRLRAIAELDRAQKQCKTNKVSAKSGDLTSAHVSDRLVAAFQEEANRLRLPVTLAFESAGVKKGVSHQRVSLRTGRWAHKTKPLEVLSEGERRAVALATFLAELAVRGDKSAVLLDDPVSSLDHERRRRVAERLAQLATERQVIVLTHDLVFLHMLEAAAKAAKADAVVREVRRGGDGLGRCRSSRPLLALRVSDHAAVLLDQHKDLNRLFNNGDMDLYALGLGSAYGLLREAWERAVEELLFNGAVMRFDHRIQTNRLTVVHDISQDDLSEVVRGMTLSSRWLTGHDMAAAINEPLPDPSDLRSEIKRFQTFVTTMRSRGRS